MENMVFIGVALVLGVAIGWVLGSRLGGGATHSDTAEQSASTESDENWWEIRETLTGTQLQILQHMESAQKATITSLQDKFSFIPDRELYYRMEQISLMGFLERERAGGEMIYRLNPAYSGTVEEDKTVFLS